MNKGNYLAAASFLQAHLWFNGIDWDKIYQMEAAFLPEVNDELDTQNFEKFDEVPMFFNSFLFSWSYFFWAFLVDNHAYFLLLILLGSHSLITRVRVHRKLVHGER